MDQLLIKHLQNIKVALSLAVNIGSITCDAYKYFNGSLDDAISMAEAPSPVQDIRLERHRVCDQCFAVGIVDTNCVCSYGRYKTIELEFEVCNCCGHVKNDGSPADTKFNKKQFEEKSK